MSSPSILVTAATSQLGSLTVEHLLTIVKDPKSVAVAVRSREKVPSTWIEKGVSVRIIDYDADSSEWAKAADGIERLLLISSNALGDQRVKQHSNIIEGARKSGTVKLLAYTSILYCETSPLSLAVDHKATEKVIRSSGIPYVLLRNGWYNENYLRAMPGWKHAGKQYSSAGDAKFSPAARQDYAEAAATVVSPSYSGQNEALELAGDTSFSYQDLAQFVSNELGKPVQVDELSPEQYASVLESIGIPPHFAKIFPQIDVNSKGGSLFNESKTLSKVIGRPTTPWQETIRAALKSE